VPMPDWSSRRSLPDERKAIAARSPRHFAAR
jgi:hypothetical protein